MRVWTRIDTIRKHLDEMVLKNVDLESRRCGYVHLYGVGMSSALIALKRGHSESVAELAEIAGMLHDYVIYATRIRRHQMQLHTSLREKINVKR